MTASVTEDLDHEIGRAVHHLRPVREAGRRIDESSQADDANNLVEIAQCDLWFPPITLPVGQSTTCYAPATTISADTTNIGTTTGQPAIAAIWTAHAPAALITIGAERNLFEE